MHIRAELFRKAYLWLPIVAGLVAIALGLYVLTGEPSGISVRGPLFDGTGGDVSIASGLTYATEARATGATVGVRGYELAVDAHDGRGYTVKDQANINCSGGCPKDAPARRLSLNTSAVPTGKLTVRVRAFDTRHDTVFSRTKQVEKSLQIGIEEPRLGRPKLGADPSDIGPHAVHGDRDFEALRARYFRIFAPWDRLEPSPGSFDWDADVGGGYVPPQLYRSTIKAQIDRAQRLGMKVIVSFQHTPCWALIPEAVPEGSDPCEMNEFGRRTNSNKASWPDPFRGVKPGKTMMDEYKEFVAAFVERFSGPAVAPERRVKFYTAWNEPNNFGESQPQICAQPHPGRERFPDFEKIPCPAGEKPGEAVSDDYYMMMYERAFDAIYRDPVPGKPGVKFDSTIELLPGDTADLGNKNSGSSSSVDEAAFTKSVIDKLYEDSNRRCPKGPWAKHSYKDIRDRSLHGVERVVRLLDGKDPETGKPVRGFSTSGCTEGVQIWITEAASLYGGRDNVDDQTASCKLSRFLNSIAGQYKRSPERDRTVPSRRVDVFIQYLFQTDPGYDSGLLGPVGTDTDGSIEKRGTYRVFKDWSRFLSSLSGTPDEKLTTCR